MAEWPVSQIMTQSSDFDEKDDSFWVDGWLLGLRWSLLVSVFNFLSFPKLIHNGYVCNVGILDVLVTAARI